MKSDRAGAIMNANRDMISNTPTISRSISDIMRLSPQGADVGNGFAVGGGNYRQSFVTVDGAAFNNTFGLDVYKRQVRNEIKNEFAKFYITEIRKQELPKCACNR